MQTASIEKAMKVVQYVEKNLGLLRRYAKCPDANCTGTSSIRLHVDGHDFSEHVEDQPTQDLLIELLEIRLRVQLAYAQDQLRLAMLEATTGTIPNHVQEKAAAA